MTLQQILVMKIVAVTVISVVLPFTFGEADHYNMPITEKGTYFSEDIDVDEKQGVEVFRVPAHNDVAAADFYHDFKSRLTVTRMLSRKACYISEMDSSLSSPRKLKADLEYAASKIREGQLPVTTQSSLVVEIGPSDRRTLSKDVLDFCGSLPIYNTEHYYNTTNGGQMSFVRPGRRQKRLIVQDFKSCLYAQGIDMYKYVRDGGCFSRELEDTWEIRCKIIPSLQRCFYYVTCKQRVQTYDFNCTGIHVSSASPRCCDYQCPT